MSFLTVNFDMRTLINSLVLIAFSFPAFTQHVHHDHSVHDIAEYEMKAALGKKVSVSQVDNTYDLIYHNIFWEIDPTQNYIKGWVESHAKFRSDQNRIQFDLYDALTVDSVEVSGQIATFTHTNDLLTINALQAWNAGEIADVKVYYQGVPAAGSFNSNNGWFHRTVFGQEINFTLSQPYGSPSWWPCKHDLVDKVDSIDIRVHVPGNEKAGTNGVLISSTPDGSGGYIHHWKHRYPIPAYLVAVAVTDYQEYNQQISLSTGVINVQNYIFPASYNFAKAQLDTELPEMMVMFDTLFGPYPFMSEKYGHAEYAMGGGMEHQTMSFMGGWSTGLMAHELAHQWFGDKVTCGSWQDIWLNEGFATFCTDIYLDRNMNQADRRNYYFNKTGEITTYPSGSVFVYDTTQVAKIFSSRLSYKKGSYVLRMLRWYIGDQAFFQGARNYLNDPKYAYGYAKTNEFIEHMEKASGKSLSEFTQDWIMNEGHVDYELKWAPTADSVHFMLAQQPSHSSVDFFEMPVPIEVEYADGTVEVFVIHHRVNKQYLGVPVSKQVVGAKVDPDYYILAGSRSTDEVDIEVIRQESIVPGDPVGIGEIEKNVLIYPNPSTGIVNVSGISEQTEIKVYELTGKELFRTKVSAQTQLDLTEYPAGIYLIEVKTQKGKVLKKVAKSDF